MEKWNLESAKKDYCKTHHKKYKKEKIDCMYCEFAEWTYDCDVYCPIKEKVIIFFTNIHAKRCKYYQRRNN